MHARNLRVVFIAALVVAERCNEEIHCLYSPPNIFRITNK